MTAQSLHDVILGPEGAYFGPATAAGADEAREKYRAWLAEQGDERAELLSIEDALLRDDFSERDAAIARAQEILAKSGFVRQWWRMISRTAEVRNCGNGDRARPQARFAYECPRTWESFIPTDDPSARHCSTCERLVYLCRSKDEAEARARRGECVTVSNPTWVKISQGFTHACTGRPDPIAMWAERVFPDEMT